MTVRRPDPNVLLPLATCVAGLVLIVVGSGLELPSGGTSTALMVLGIATLTAASGSDGSSDI